MTTSKDGGFHIAPVTGPLRDALCVELEHEHAELRSSPAQSLLILYYYLAFLAGCAFLAANSYISGQLSPLLSGLVNGRSRLPLFGLLGLYGLVFATAILALVAWNSLGTLIENTHKSKRRRQRLEDLLMGSDSVSRMAVSELPHDSLYGEGMVEIMAATLWYLFFASLWALLLLTAISAVRIPRSLSGAVAAALEALMLYATVKVWRYTRRRQDRLFTLLAWPEPPTKPLTLVEKVRNRFKTVSHPSTRKVRT